jgi:glycosyltransferase involved in cell wall biosynthesis
VTNKLVSVITPCYNGADYITQTIESVLAQTYENWEMIVVDDCSTDSSYDIILKYTEKDARIKLCRMDKNRGAAQARNKAIELSKGDYLAFLDSDDLWFPDKIEKQLQFMINNDCDFSFTEYEQVDDKNKLLSIARVTKKISYKKMLLHCFTGCSTVMYKQNLNDKIYGPLITSCNDYALFLRILQHTRNARGYPECLTKYRIRKGSLSRNKIKKMKSYFDLMINYEHINIFFMFLCLCTNQLIKIIWKYKKISSKSVNAKIFSNLTYDNLRTKSLGGDLDLESVSVLFNEERNEIKEVSIWTYFDVILQVNSAMIRKVLNMSDSALRMERVIEKAGLTVKYEARGEEKARSEIARSLLDMGWTAEQTARTSRLSIEKVQTLYEDAYNH